MMKVIKESKGSAIAVTEEDIIKSTWKLAEKKKDFF